MAQSKAYRAYTRGMAKRHAVYARWMREDAPRFSAVPTSEQAVMDVADLPSGSFALHALPKPPRVERSGGAAPHFTASGRPV